MNIPLGKDEIALLLRDLFVIKENDKVCKNTRNTHLNIFQNSLMMAI